MGNRKESVHCVGDDNQVVQGRRVDMDKSGIYGIQARQMKKEFQMRPRLDCGTWSWIYDGEIFHHAADNWWPSGINLTIEYANRILERW
jgi:hypothetical protein